MYCRHFRWSIRLEEQVQVFRWVLDHCESSVALLYVHVGWQPVESPRQYTIPLLSHHDVMGIYFFLFSPKLCSGNLTVRIETVIKYLYFHDGFDAYSESRKQYIIIYTISSRESSRSFLEVSTAVVHTITCTV